MIGFFVFFITNAISPIFSKLFLERKNTVGIVGTYNFSNLPIPIERFISLGLTDVSDDDEPIAALAEKWETTNDGKTYIFHLKNDIFWHDGMRFTAYDVNYRLKDAKLIPVDNNTLKIEMKEPFAPLPVLFSKPILKKTFIGVGPYKVRSFKFKGDHLTQLILSSIMSGGDEINYKFYPSYEEAKLAFKLGEVNSLEDWPTYDDFTAWKARVEEKTLYNRLFAVFFNTKDSFLKQKEVRQALNFAIPNFPDFEETFTPISPLSWAYYNKVRLYKYDPDNAEKILKKVGASTSSAELKLTTFPLDMKVAEKIANSWKKVGVNVTIRVVNSTPSDYQAILLSQDLSPDPDQYFLWQATQDSTNLSRYSNQKIDMLLETGRRTIDKDKRTKIYADFQRYLVDDAPVAFLYYPKVYRITRRY